MSFKKYIVNTPETSRRLINVPTDASALTEQVIAMYASSNGQSVADNTSHRINFETLVQDTHSAVTTGSGAWQFTAPVAGTYQILSHVSINAFATPSADIALFLHVYREPAAGGGFSKFKVLAEHRKSSWNIDSIGGSCLAQLSAGDKIYINLIQISGGAEVLYNEAANNFVDIILVGP